MDAEKYINDYTRKCSNELCLIQDKYGKQMIAYNEWLTPDQAKRAVEIAKQETIERACEWLRICNYAFSYKMIDDFRKAMEE